MLPAARFGDLHVCPAPEHVGGPVVSPPTALVLTNSQAQARGTDPAACVGPVDFIVTGAATVKVHGQPAARMTDKTMHGGFVALGSGNVTIGGPTAGVTLGNVEAGQEGMSSGGRRPGLGKHEAELLQLRRRDVAADHQPGDGQGADGGRAPRPSRRERPSRQREPANDDDDIDDNDGSSPKGVPNRAKAGGTYPDQREQLLDDNGVPAEQVPGTMGNLAQGAAEGKGVEADVWAGLIWPPSYGVKPGKGAHCVLVTGVEYDENGNMKNVIINDTGAGDCGKAYPADVFKKALMGDNHVVTKRPVW